MLKPKTQDINEIMRLIYMKELDLRLMGSRKRPSTVHLVYYYRKNGEMIEGVVTMDFSRNKFVEMGKPELALLTTLWEVARVLKHEGILKK